MLLAPGGSKTGALLNMLPKRTHLSTMKSHLTPDVIMPRLKILSQEPVLFRPVFCISLGFCLMASNKLLDLIAFTTKR